VRKRPATGDYRVHEEHGGTTLAADPGDAVRELAARVVAALPVAPLYARVDLLHDRGLWHVLEVEVTEPALWLDLAPPASTGRLVDALVARLR
jgi:hypothetical protein